MATKKIPPQASFVLQHTCCGKRACGACGGVRYTHGPYWYAAWWDAKKERHRTAYVGVELDALQARRQRRQK